MITLSKRRISVHHTAIKSSSVSLCLAAYQHDGHSSKPKRRLANRKEETNPIQGIQSIFASCEMAWILQFVLSHYNIQNLHKK